MIFNGKVWSSSELLIRSKNMVEAVHNSLKPFNALMICGLYSFS